MPFLGLPGGASSDRRKLVAPPPPELLLEILFVRHGYSCANAWKKRRGLYGFYSDPELTDEGIRLCRERKPDLMTAIANCFPENSYTIGTSCLMRTQETAYYMLMEGNDALKYSIFRHVAEEGMGANNSPMDPELQKDALEKRIPRIRDRILRDFRGRTDLIHKSNWSMFLEWIVDMANYDRNVLFHKTETADGKPVYRVVLFTHGNFMRHNLGEDTVNNNDFVFARINAATKTIEYKLKLSHYKKPDTGNSVKGCRIQRGIDLLNPFLVRERKTRKRAQRQRAQRQRQRQTRRQRQRQPYSRK